MKKLMCLVAMMMASTPALAAESNKYAQSGDWYISDDNDGSCSMIGGYAQDTLFHISYNSRLERTVLTFVDPAYKSLADGDTKMMSLSFRDANGKHDRGWGSGKYTIGVMKDGARMMSGTYTGSVMLDDLRRNTLISLWYDGTVVESLTLKGIAPAVNLLEQCAIADAKEHPVDIFAK